MSQLENYQLNLGMLPSLMSDLESSVSAGDYPEAEHFAENVAQTVREIEEYELHRDYLRKLVLAKHYHIDSPIDHFVTGLDEEIKRVEQLLA